jgi:hypothetical protein
MPKWKLSPEQSQLVARHASGVDPRRAAYDHNWTWELWTPGKRLVGLYLGELHDPRLRAADYREAGLITRDGNLLHFFLDRSGFLNLAQVLKPIPVGAPVEIACDTKMVKDDQLVFRAMWEPPKPAR